MPDTSSESRAEKDCRHNIAFTLAITETIASLIKIPTDIQFTLYLIKEELKSRKLFDTFHQVGFDDCYFQPHLDSLILRSLDMNDNSDKTFDTYYEIMERRSKKIEADHDTITRQALKAYYELLDVKKRLAASEG